MSWLRRVYSSLKSPHTRQIVTIGVYVTFPLSGLYLIKSKHLEGIASHPFFSASTEITGEYEIKPKMESRRFLENWNTVYQDPGKNLESYHQRQVQYIKNRIDQGIFDQEILDLWEQKYEVMQKTNFLLKKENNLMKTLFVKVGRDQKKNDKLWEKLEETSATLQLEREKLNLELEKIKENELLRITNQELNKAQEIIFNVFTEKARTCDQNSEYLQFADEFKDECKHITQNIEKADEKIMLERRSNLIAKMKSKFMDIITTNVSENTQKLKFVLLPDMSTDEEFKNVDQKIGTQQIQPVTEMVTTMAEFFLEPKQKIKISTP